MRDCPGTLRCATAGELDDGTLIFQRELRGSRGMGVVSNNWFDRVLLSILCIFEPSCWPMFQPPSWGPP